MIPIIEGLDIPDHEIEFTASRSGGPGGQNVNKVSSKITLWFDIGRSSVLNARQQDRLRKKLASRINKDGVLHIASQQSRSQDINRQNALERFAELLRQALHEEPPRVPTRPSRSSRTARLDEKHTRATIKQARSRKGWEE